MNLAIILIGGWLMATGVVTLFAWSLGRAAAIGDRQDEALLATSAVPDRRVGPADRRDQSRRRLAGSPCRRAEDLRHRDVGAADLALLE
ncbi:MAG: hypothetical protein M3088_01105, partial [Actinomycetota bacterium]|nr:hypothetical protein [Actinomycetota bacterium]